LQQQSISKKQIQKYYDCIVNEYDTTKKDVKHVLKRLIKWNAILKDGKKRYSYLEPQKRSRDISVITDRTNERKRQSEESSDDVSVSTTEPKMVMKRKRIHPKCSVDGCNALSRTGYSVCTKHGAKTYKYTCSHEGYVLTRL